MDELWAFWDDCAVYVGQSSLRALRAAVFAAACVLVSAALHVLAGGALLRAEALAAALMLTWLGAFLLARRQRGMDVLLGACFAAQYGMHHVFTAGAAPATSSPWTHDHGSGLGMLLIHAVTGVLSAWALERGESALALIVHLAVTPVRGLRAMWRILVGSPVEIVPPAPGPMGHRPLPPPRRSDFVVVVARRGPPVVVSVL
ncbi:hypothetical protein DQ384_08355 [Sphaerisporangium album]|uniref:Uncharacterized protein n=1 Tax=Sphaerisporangium album TaxID=509200 RepID=A0A367FPM8_9ACTN|nr:hypothetical protein [Sphaerisporangium album]RCG31575.1 hypothetical protein DQ384_08355 [Sphaerisporangium album]